jgi:hypothetical protein
VVIGKGQLFDTRRDALHAASRGSDRDADGEGGDLARATRARFQSRHGGGLVAVE